MTSLNKKVGPSPRPPLHRSKSQECELENEVNHAEDTSIEEDRNSTCDPVETDDDKNSGSEDETFDRSSRIEEQEKEIKTSFRRESPKFDQSQKELSQLDQTQEQSDKQLGAMGIGLLVIILGIVVSTLKFYLSLPVSADSISIDTIKHDFATQDDTLWTDFESGVHDVITLNKPSSFIFLYKGEAEQTLNYLLPQLTKFAVCQITSCDKTPIILTPNLLNSPEIQANYGILIEKYQDKLRENGVMVVKNLEDVHGNSAQAFHAFCDEYTPLVEKSLFIFTMKVDEFPSASKIMKFVEDFLSSQWRDIKTDIASALITRITSMVVVIRA